MPQKPHGLVFKLISSFFKYLRFSDRDREHHLTVSFVDKKLHFKFQNHADYISDLGWRLQEDRPKYQLREFIVHALTETSECKYIIFHGYTRDWFIQYWRGDGKIMLDFPVFKANPTSTHKDQVRRLLLHQGFSHISPHSFMKTHTYTTESFPGCRILFADFGTDISSASEFTYTVITKILHQNPKLVNVEVG